MDQSQLLSACQGLQKMIRNKKMETDQHRAMRELATQEVLEIGAQIEAETDSEVALTLTGERDEARRRISELDSEIEAAQATQTELENDYRLQQCEVLTGTLE